MDDARAHVRRGGRGCRGGRDARSPGPTGVILLPVILSAGSRLGPYEIVAPLGAGGMGEVWRARDSRIGREVAIKILPPEYSADRERLSRFEQEARAAGMLNHPNIL